MNEKVAIVGKAPSSRMMAPYDDSSWDIWSLSDAHQYVTRWDRWFELHDPYYHKTAHPEHWKFLSADHDGKPIYMLREYSDLPASREYPLQEIMRLCGGCINGQEEFRYWTNSVSYMMAMAIAEGYKEIGLYGIDMAMSDEYAVQRPSCEFVIGFGVGRGVNFIIPGESDILKAHRLYGYDTHSGDAYVQVRTRTKELQERINHCDNEARSADRACQIHYGALQELQNVVKQNGKLEEYMPKRTKELEEEIRKLSSHRDNNERQKWVLTGALDDQNWIKTVLFT